MALRFWLNAIGMTAVFSVLLFPARAQKQSVQRERAAARKPGNWVARFVKRIKPAIVIVRATREKSTEKERRTQAGLGVIIAPEGITVMPRRLVQGARTIEV